jgi:hypothetical protein
LFVYSEINTSWKRKWSIQNKAALFPDRLRSKQVNLLKRILIFVVENVTIWSFWFCIDHFLFHDVLISEYTNKTVEKIPQLIAFHAYVLLLHWKIIRNALLMLWFYFDRYLQCKLDITELCNIVIVWTMKSDPNKFQFTRQC